MPKSARTPEWLPVFLGLLVCLEPSIARGAEVIVRVDGANEELVKHYTHAVSFGLTFEDGLIISRVMTHEELFKGEWTHRANHEAPVASCEFAWLVSTKVLSDQKELGVLHHPAEFKKIEDECEKTPEGYVIRPGAWKFYELSLSVGNSRFQSGEAAYLFLNLDVETPNGDTFVPSLGYSYESKLEKVNTPYTTKMKFLADEPFLVKANLTWLLSDGSMPEEQLLDKDGTYDIVIE
jgi:hypothetical protein